MTQPIIRVENLSKVYRIGLRDEMPDTMVTALTGLVRKPWQNFQQLRRLGKFRDDEEHADMLWALRDVSFEVNEGEVVGIIGRNGAGKSTLLKILSRITEPSTGRAVLNGRVSSLLEVGTGFHPELTGRENIYMNGTILGMRKREIDSKFDEIVDFSGVEKFLDTPSKRYSSGMKVRLAFAVAAHLEPEILIIDEVLAVGDAEFQKKCLGKMKDVASSGRTVLFVSHNMAAVEKLCTRAIMLVGGTIAHAGSVKEVCNQYLDHFQNSCNMTGYYCQPADESTDDALAVLEEAELLNAKGQRTDSLRFGEPFTIKMRWQHNKSIPALAYAIRFHDAREDFLTAINTLQLEDESLYEAGKHEAICHFPKNCFPPGAYALRLSAAVRPHTQIAAYENVLGLNVEDAPWREDLPYLISPKAKFVIDGDWSHQIVNHEYAENVHNTSTAIENY